MRSWRPCLVTVIGLSTVNCADPNSGAESSHEIQNWSAVEELRLGSVAGAEGTRFGQIAGLALDDSGRIHILDFQTQEVRIFGEDGSHERTIGGLGNGPGEFRRASGLSFGPDGNLVVWDPGAGRFTTFSRQGEVVATTPRTTRGVVYPWRGGFTPDGVFIDWGVEYPEREAGTNQAGSTLHYHAIEVDLGTGAVDTLHTYVGERETGATGSIPFGRASSLHFSRFGDVWISDPRAYRIQRYALSGETIASYSLPGEPAPVTSTELDSVRATLSERSQRDTDWDAVPSTKQIVRRMFDDGDGHLFVLPELGDVPLGTAADVIDVRTGTHIARLQFPEALHYPYPPPIGYGDRILAVVRDELDVEYVVRYQIER